MVLIMIKCRYWHCFSIFRSFFFTQMDVDDPAAKQQGDAHPGQDEAVTKAS